MSDIAAVDVAKLPEDVREKLAELDLELSEGGSISMDKNPSWSIKMRLFDEHVGRLSDCVDLIRRRHPWSVFREGLI